ncbi:MAG: hypothetical protein AAGL18_13340 [Pseudomonadota bacterium]
MAYYIFVMVWTASSRRAFATVGIGTLALVGAMTAASVPVFAAISMQPLKTLRAREAEERELAEEVAFTNEVCGTSIRASIDWSTAESWPEQDSIAMVCDGALSALESICRGDASRARSISSFECAGDGTGPSLGGGSLRYGASPGGASSAFSETKAYLERTL